MKRTVIAISASLLLVPTLSFAAQGTWTGEISDNMCGASHQAMAKPGQKVNPRQCTLACVKAGGQYVLVSNGKIFDLTNQKLPGLQQYAGEKVRVTGDLGNDGKTITVTQIQPER